MSRSRAEGIASGFEIGLCLFYHRGSDGSLGGYHYWALFRVPGKTWVPVDTSEGDKLPVRRRDFLGGHTRDRVTLSTGRDIVPEPAHSGGPLNYFVDPYAEADGYPAFATKEWTFQDLNRIDRPTLRRRCLAPLGTPRHTPPERTRP